MAQVGIVCDSTCDLAPEWLEDHDVRMVPLTVLFGDESFRDWIDLQPREFYERLASSPALPTTSQPSPADFAAVYSQLAAEGCESIVSIHLTAELSGTFHSATLAASDATVPVHVIDTKRVTAATALVIKQAISMRDQGRSAEEIADAAVATSASMRLYFVLDTLDYLVKGGRAGKAQGLAASLLSIKPVLMFNDEGTIEPYRKLKGTHKALTALAEHVAADAREHGRMRVSLLHADDLALAEELHTALDVAGADYELDSIQLVGAVIGTYAGPRAVGAGYYPIG